MLTEKNSKVHRTKNKIYGWASKFEDQNSTEYEVQRKKTSNVVKISNEEVVAPKIKNKGK